MDYPESGVLMKIKKASSNTINNEEALRPIQYNASHLICPFIYVNQVSSFYEGCRIEVDNFQETDDFKFHEKIVQSNNIKIYPCL